MENPESTIEKQRFHEQMWKNIMHYGAIIAAAIVMAGCDSKSNKEENPNDTRASTSEIEKSVNYLSQLQESKDHISRVELVEGTTLTDAEKALMSFPEEINCLKIESVYTPERFDKLIIFIKQMHLQSSNMQIFQNLSDDGVRNKLDEVNDIQKMIYSGLIDLKEKVGIKKVFVETIDEISEPIIKHDLTSDKNNVFAFYLTPHFTKAFHVENTELSKLFDEYKYAIGAALVLYSEGKLEIEAAENRKIHDDAYEIANDVLGKNKSRLSLAEKQEFQTKVLDAREEFLTEKIESRPDVLGVCVFGYDHDFSKTAKRMNRHSKTHTAVITLSADNTTKEELDLLK